MANQFVKGLNGGVPIAPDSLTDADGIPVQQSPSSLVWTTLGNLKTFLANLFAPLASPAFTGNPTAPTQTAGNNSTRLATTQFVQSALAGVSGSSSPALFASWSTGSTRVVVEGDSIAAGVSTLLSTQPGFNGACTYNNYGHPGDDMGAITSRYVSSVKPHRPAANGGTAGVTESWIILVDGGGMINDINNGTSATAMTQLDSYITTALADGFKIAVCTTYYQAGCKLVGLSQLISTAQAANCDAVNRFIIEHPNITLKIPAHTVISGPNDPLMTTDLVHLTTTGYTALAALIARCFAAGLGGSIKESTTLKGNAPDSVATHANIGLAAHTYGGAAQVQTPQTIAYLSDINWNVAANQTALTVLTGDVNITATGMANGGIYRYLIKPSGHVVTFDDQVFKFPPSFEEPTGGKEDDSTGALYDLWEFYSDGTYLYRKSRTVIDPSVPATTGAILEDYFTSDGTDHAINGRTPDTAQNGSVTWYASSSGAKVSAAGNYLIGTYSNNNYATYDIGLYDNFSLKWKQTAVNCEGNGPSNDIGAEVIFRLAPNSDPSATSCVALRMNQGSNNSAHTVQFWTYPNGWNSATGAATIGGTASVAVDDNCEIRVVGSSLKLFVNGTQVLSVTNSDNNSAGHTAIGFFTGSNLGQTFIAPTLPGPIQHVLVTPYP